MKDLHPFFKKVDLTHVNASVISAGDTLRLFTGVVNNAASYWMDDTLDELRKDKRFRQKVKKAFNHAVEVRRQYEMKLKYPAPGELRFFDPERMSPRQKKMYKDGITVEDRFEYWQATGGELYSKTLHLMKVLTWKYEQKLSKRGVENPHPIAMAITAESVMVMAVHFFEYALKKLIPFLPQLNEDYWRIFGCLSFGPVLQAWTEALSTIPFGFSEDDYDSDTQTAFHAIQAIWQDPIEFLKIKQKTAEEYAVEMFRTKGMMRKYHEEEGKIIEDMEEEARQIKLENLKQQWEKKNLTSGTPT